MRARTLDRGDRPRDAPTGVKSGMFTVGLVVLGVVAIGACGHVATQPSAPQSAAPAVATTNRTVV